MTYQWKFSQKDLGCGSNRAYCYFNIRYIPCVNWLQCVRLLGNVCHSLLMNRRD